MRKLFVIAESDPRETRVALTPNDAKKLVQLGWDVEISRGAGVKAGFPDESYALVGATIAEPEAERDADFVVSVRAPSITQVMGRKRGSFHLSLLDPFDEKPLIKAFADAGVTAASFEMIPRSTIAQKMDVLSSQSNLAGYCSVIKAVAAARKIVPMMMTPAGTISPLKFFIVGVGVAGLQAIATAKRLGARVEAFDTRPVVEEQVRSLGAKFVKIDLGETGQTAQGYAKALTPEQIELQRKGMAKVCAQADVVITTAKLFGRKAPVIITSEMVAGMKAGSIIVDLAVESGGNVEGSKPDQNVITPNGVLIMGSTCPEASVPETASQMYGSNVFNFIEYFSQNGAFEINPDDPIMKSCIVARDGKITDERFVQK